MGDVDGLAMQANLIAESMVKASSIRGFINSYGANVRHILTAQLSERGSHGDSKPVEIGSAIMNQLSQEEMISILTMFAKAQDRITRRLARTMDEHYGVVIEGLTPEADDAHL